MDICDRLEALRMVASRGDNYRFATKKRPGSKGQVATVAWKLNALIESAAEHELGVSLGDTLVREVRLEFLNELFGRAGYLTARYGGEITSAAELTISEASALLDWAFGEGAEDELALWLRDNVDELGVPYAEMMF